MYPLDGGRRSAPAQRLSPTGIAGLDEILGGGLPPNRTYLVEGPTGTGKTTLSIQFLLEGLRRDEVCLYVGLSESRAELDSIAASHGWSLDGLHVLDLSAGSETKGASEGYSLFRPSEIELPDTMRRVLEEVDRLRPSRAAIDSLSEMQMLAGDPLLYRRQIAGLKAFFAGRACTLLLVEETGSEPSTRVYSLVSGIVELAQVAPTYGSVFRRLVVRKLRGSSFLSGYHDMAIRSGGIAVFPRIGQIEAARLPARPPLSSGLDALDAMLGGGLDAGTTTLLVGASGTGKSTVAVQLAIAAVRRGESAGLLVFDETLRTLTERASACGMQVAPLIEGGRLLVREIDPGEVSPGELARSVATWVREARISLLVVDSLNGYFNSHPDRHSLGDQLRDLLRFSANHGVTTLLVAAQHGLFGPAVSLPMDVGHVSDTTLLLRFFETGGAVHRAVAVLKKRGGIYERSIRELDIGARGIRVGAPVHEFTGILTGLPTFAGASRQLLFSDATGDAPPPPAR